MSSVDIWKFLAGIGLFIFGIELLENSLKRLGSRSFKLALARQTKSVLRSILTGTLATSILQSSSVVMLMVLAFVGAGVITMQNALGIVLGSNLGTTITGWIVATLGFKFDIESLTYPLLAVGSLGLAYFSAASRQRDICRLLVGFGLLFLGLSYMKGSMEFVSQHFDLSRLKDYGNLYFLLFGTFFAAVVQSSSATMVITLSAVHAGVIPLIPAMAIAVGADLGTTSTVLIGALKGSADKRRVALAHLLFNLVTDLIAFAAIPVFSLLIVEWFRIDDPLIALVFFHSSFNFMGILIFLPLINPFSQFLQRRFQESKNAQARHITHVSVEVQDLALQTLRKELLAFVQEVVLLNQELLTLKNNQNQHHPRYLSWLKTPSSLVKHYLNLKQWEGEILDYVFSLQKKTLSPSEVRESDRHLSCVRNSVFSVKSIKDIKHNFDDIDQSIEENLIRTYQDLQALEKKFYQKISDFLQVKDTSLFELLTDLKTLNESNHQKIHQIIIERAKADLIADSEASTLLNVNRELQTSNSYLIAALKELYLDEKSIENFEALPVRS